MVLATGRSVLSKGLAGFSTDQPRKPSFAQPDAITLMLEVVTDRNGGASGGLDLTACGSDKAPYLRQRSENPGTAYKRLERKLVLSEWLTADNQEFGTELRTRGTSF